MRVVHLRGDIDHLTMNGEDTKRGLTKFLFRTPPWWQIFCPASRPDDTFHEPYMINRFACARQGRSLKGGYNLVSGMVVLLLLPHYRVHSNNGTLSLPNTNEIRTLLQMFLMMHRLGQIITSPNGRCLIFCSYSLADIFVSFFSN
ncbi:hypothetical protein CEXT_615941 [Caerostris extrusa]|uniref:Uncharacterized protein n=1 Tax=Caerostris extrusa TaxID=172846 RepID=A0AAV4SMB8_CAEEX|nr:hypothetical protein CEXT_615941 [Caerostris extrusa]